MTKTTVQIHDNNVALAASNIAVGSPHWFVWLDTTHTFRYFSTARQSVHKRGDNIFTAPLAPISLRKERRRNGTLWYAYRRVNSTLHKRYVGKTAALTAAHLDEISLTLNQLW